MLKELGRLFYLSSSIVFLTCCAGKYKGDFSVIEADKEINYKPCTIAIKGNKFSINQVRVYKDGILTKREGCLTEGWFTLDFEKDDNTYSNEDEAVKELSISRKIDEISYFDKKYKIILENNDSIVVEESRGNYLIFIGDIKQYTSSR